LSEERPRAGAIQLITRSGQAGCSPFGLLSANQRALSSRL
jgi:hypothetical protein